MRERVVNGCSSSLARRARRGDDLSTLRLTHPRVSFAAPHLTPTREMDWRGSGFCRIKPSTSSLPARRTPSAGPMPESSQTSM